MRSSVAVPTSCRPPRRCCRRARRRGGAASTVDRIVESGTTRRSRSWTASGPARRPSTDEIVDELVRKYSGARSGRRCRAAQRRSGDRYRGGRAATGGRSVHHREARRIVSHRVAYITTPGRRGTAGLGAAVLSMGKGASGVEVGRAHRRRGRRGSSPPSRAHNSTRSIPGSRRMLARLASEQSASRPSAPPFIGTGRRRRNVLIVRSVARTARSFLRRTVDGADPRGRPRRDRRGGCRRLSRE